MAVRLTFRSKLLAIISIAAFAFVALVGAGAFITNRVERQLTTIQERYLPKLELEPELEGEFDRIQRAFQDAVAIRDPDALSDAREAKRRFTSDLDLAGGALDSEAASALRAGLDDYYASASDVSRRLITGETGEAVVDAVANMQTKQKRVTELVKRAAALDKHDLADAFATATRSERAARSYQIWIGAACLSAVLLLSLALSRSVLSVVVALASGLQRFGTGDFSQPILVSSQDELGQVAHYANQMAASLHRLGLERERVELALSLSNRELEAFSYSVAHDLRAPLRGINGFSRALIEDFSEALDDEAKEYLRRIAAAAGQMGLLIDSLLALSRVSRVAVHRETVNMTQLAESIVKQLRSAQPDRTVSFETQKAVIAHGDPVLLRAVLENLIGNAWKFTGGKPSAQISFGLERSGEGLAYYVRDNGAGFDMEYVGKLFTPFQRLHSTADFAGTGIGLATVERIIHRHGGKIWAEGAKGEGATFRFTIPASSASPSSNVGEDPQRHQGPSQRRGMPV